MLNRCMRLGSLSLLPLTAALVGCAALTPNLPAPLPVKPAASQAIGASPGEAPPRELRVSAAPAAPAASDPLQAELTPPKAADDEAVAAVNLQQIPLPAFIQVVYAEILKKTVNLHPSVISRTDLVTFRSGGGQTTGELAQAMRVLLKSYGLSVIDAGGLTRIVPDNAATGDLPGIRFGAASPDVPSPLRPVFHLLTLNSVRQTDVTNWLRTMFGDRVRVSEDAGRNAVVLTGNPDNIKAALDAIQILDQPAMKGRSSLALTPAYWSAEEMARRLQELLSAEGYAVHPVGTAVVPGSLRNPIILLPVASLNVIYVFANSDAVASHIANWARNLDRPGERGVGRSFFTYGVKHKDANDLAQTLDRILGGSRTSATPATAAVAPAAAGALGANSQASAPSSAQYGSVVVDKSTNTLIITQARPEEYGQLTALLESLDRPAKSALIEVTVAELSLNNTSDIGVDWLTGRLAGSGNYTVSSKGGGVTDGSAGLSFRIFNGAGVMRAALSALASNNRATILSSPRLMARNGETATIQVGQEVPIITSQQQGVVSGTTTTGVIQTVQYRNTGVILKIKPVIHSGDQIDIDVDQEVSDAAKTETGVSASPTFGLRKIATKLTLRNGATVILGGLISEKGTDGGAGIPFLKDIPMLGNLFSKQTKTGERRELIILITPYIANDSYEAEAITDAFRKSLGGWASRVQPEGDKGNKNETPR